MLNPIVYSMRLRTLPLSLSGVICGVGLAEYFGGQIELPIGMFSAWRIFFLILTTVSLQILSNMSNELGDYLSGTDSNERQGPNYSLAQGAVSEQTLRRMIRVFVVLCCVFGIAMVYCTFGTLLAVEPIVLLLLGAAAIWASMHYTLGKNPYGYRGWGDLFVFIFFGLVSVLGGYYIYAVSIPPLAMLLPASAIGLFSVGVLNVNNIRDMSTDANTRTTIPLKIGEHRAKVYQTVLIVSGWLCLIIFTTIADDGWPHYLYLVTLPFYVIHVIGVWRHSGQRLDPMLPLLVMSTFVLSLLLAFCPLLSNL